MKTGFSLWSSSNREKYIFIIEIPGTENSFFPVWIVTEIPATENRFFPVWKY
jgi:hypothetical protein